jgi:hypothetical protein
MKEISSPGQILVNIDSTIFNLGSRYNSKEAYEGLVDERHQS